MPERGSGWEAEADSRGIDLVDLDQLELLKHTHTALHLVGLGVRALEALNEVGRLGDELLLLLVGLHLLLAALGTQALVFGVVYLIVVEATHGDLEGTRSDVVDEGAVVADDDDRLPRLDEEVLEPLDRLDVEVVRRLVEDEEVCGAKEELDKGYTTTLAPTRGRTTFFSDSSPPNIKAPRRSIDAQANVALRFAVDGLVDGVVPIQLLALRLAK